MLSFYPNSDLTRLSDIMPDPIHQEIVIGADEDNSFTAHMSLPRETTDPAPCVIVIQEIFGVNDGIREKCDWLAEQGFIAIAPDLFWRIEPGIELSDQVPEELERAFELFGLFDVEQGLDDLKATLEAINTIESTGKVGCMGYCLGGKMAYLMACNSDIKASIGYYGVGIENILADANNIQNPLMLHIAEKDGFVPPEAQEKIQAGLDDNAHITLHFYEGVDHAFTRVGGDNYEPKAGQIADNRTISFLKENLV